MRHVAVWTECVRTLELLIVWCVLLEICRQTRFNTCLSEDSNTLHQTLCNSTDSLEGEVGERGGHQ